jgi:hypothetical protein
VRQDSLPPLPKYSEVAFIRNYDSDHKCHKLSEPYMHLGVSAIIHVFSLAHFGLHLRCLCSFNELAGTLNILFYVISGLAMLALSNTDPGFLRQTH